MERTQSPSLTLVKPTEVSKANWNPVKITWDIPQLVDKLKDKGHFYQVDDQVLPSVTTILKKFPSEGLIAWRKAVGDAAADRTAAIAAARGRNLHKHCESYWKTGAMDWLGMMPDTKMVMKNLIPFLDRVSNIRAIELPVFSRILGVAGTIDLVADYDGIPSIIDIKSSGGIKIREWLDNYFIQITGYSVMWYELTAQPYRNLVILMGAYEDGEGAVFKETLGHDHMEKMMNVIKQYRKNHKDV